MFRLANDHKIDLATNPTFAARLQKHIEFLGLSDTSEMEIIATQDSNFADVHEATTLQQQKVTLISINT